MTRLRWVNRSLRCQSQCKASQPHFLRFRVRIIFRPFRDFALWNVSGSNRWSRRFSDQSALIWPALGDQELKPSQGSFYGPYPQYGWDFPEEIPERPRKRSQSVSWNFPREYGWDAPSPIIQGIWGFQSISRVLSPPVRLGTPLFSEVVPERASQNWSWNSQQYWEYFWFWEF